MYKLYHLKPYELPIPKHIFINIVLLIRGKPMSFILFEDVSNAIRNSPLKFINFQQKINKI